MNSSTPESAVSVDRARILSLAWPIILANCAAPLLGLADTAVIGNTGSVADLGAIALGALIFSFVYWTFGFLRMGTTGLTAQADGAGEEPEVRAGVARALGIALVLGVVLWTLRGVVAWGAFAVLDASVEVEATARRYVLIRIWGAPAALALFAVSGALIGLGASRRLLAVQLTLNALNIALDILFAGVLGWGPAGIAAGTAIAEWVTLGFGVGILVVLLRRRRRDSEGFWPVARILDRQRFVATIGVNSDIMVRTVALLTGFAWFTNQGARYGDVVLAANHVLLQLVSFSAFFLDGFAFVTESLVGSAVGSRSRELFEAAIRLTTQLAAFTALGLAGLLWLVGGRLIVALTDLATVRSTAVTFLPFAVVYVTLSFPAFQLDGIFIGATRSREMRNASIVSLLFFLLAWRLLAIEYGNHGLWIAFILYVLARAVALGGYLPGLRVAVGPDDSGAVSTSG